MSTTVRISDDTHRRMGRIAEKTGKSLGDVVDDAIRAYERKMFFEAFNNAYAELRDDDEAWAEELEERREWERSNLDGLDEDRAGD